MSARFALAIHAASLPTEAPGGWYHLIPAGTFMGRDGRGPYQLSDPTPVLEAFAARGADLCVDYNHQTLTAQDKQGPVPASGWIKELQWREDGLWGRIDWTEPAAAALQAKEYRYLSPVFAFDRKTGEVKRLDGAGLTNDPNLHLQAAASRQGDAPMDELLERLCYMLNLPLTTTKDEMLAQLDKLKAMIAASQEATAAASSMATALGLAGTSRLAEIATALNTRLAQAPDPAKWVPIAELQAANTRVALLDGQIRGQETDRLVKEAMAAGKVPPSMEAWARDYASRDPKGFQAYVAATPVLTGTLVPSGDPSSAPSGAMDPDVEAMCRMFGNDPKDIAIAMKEK